MDKKMEYVTPELVVIELVPDETISLGCWPGAPSSC